MHARRLARPSSVCARRAANICPIASIDLAENFIDSRKRSVDNLGHLAPQGIEFDSQLLYIPLAFFAATIEIAHAPPRYPSSTKNCSNSPRKFNGGPLVPSDPKRIGGHGQGGCTWR